MRRAVRVAVQRMRVDTITAHQAQVTHRSALTTTLLPCTAAHSLVSLWRGRCCQVTALHADWQRRCDELQRQHADALRQRDHDAVVWQQQLLRERDDDAKEAKQVRCCAVATLRQLDVVSLARCCSPLLHTSLLPRAPI
jgi:hypothetical protein